MDKIDKLWELMGDVDSLEDIYETEDGTIAFIFDSEGNADKRIEQIRKGLDKEGYMNSFEGTNGTNVIIFDIDFEDDLEEDWRDSTFTENDFNRYVAKMKSDVYSLSNSIQYMVDKHPEYADLFDNLVSEIVDIFSRSYINKSVSDKSANESRNTAWDSSRVVDLVSDCLAEFDESKSINEDSELTEDFDINSLSDREKYMFLDRMKQDCEYFIGNGNRDTKHLFYNSVKEHIESMKELYNSLKEKPEWLSMEDIEEFEKKMTETL